MRLASVCGSFSGHGAECACGSSSTTATGSLAAAVASLPINVIRSRDRVGAV